MLESNLAFDTIYGNYEDDSWNDLSRSSYSVGLKIAVMQAENNKPIGKYNRKRLVEFDSTLKEIEDYFDEKTFGWSINLHGGFDDVPSKYDIKRKFDEFVHDKISMGYSEDKDKYILEYLRIGFNTLKNNRRVLYRLLNNEPLDLINEDVDDFKKFADELRNPPEKNVLSKYRRFL